MGHFPRGIDIMSQRKIEKGKMTLSVTRDFDNHKKQNACPNHS